jgi:IclR family acetate operon transcriptional repressor
MPEDTRFSDTPSSNVTAQDNNQDNNQVQSVTRALHLLAVVETAGGVLSISEMASGAALTVGTTHRLAHTLLANGYLRQLPDRRYCLGSRLIALGASANALIGMRARPVLRSLADQFGESANLAVLSASSAEYVAQVAGSHSMRMFTEVGRRVPLHSTGVGKALLSMLSEEQIRKLLEPAELTSYTPTTITDLDALLDDLESIRRQGYAMDDGEMEIGVRCVAAPVSASSLMAISVSGPAARMTGGVVRSAVGALARARTDLIAILDDHA